MTRLNHVGAELAKNPDVHAMTDVTGFGILGHGLEMARGSGLKLTVMADSVRSCRAPLNWCAKVS
jgi:selenide,water dikinase